MGNMCLVSRVEPYRKFGDRGRNLIKKSHIIKVHFLIEVNKMAVSFGCKCEVKNKDNWKVLHRNHNHSVFESPKYCEHYSEYSSVRCVKCGSIGRTKAKYVVELEDDLDFLV